MLHSDAPAVAAPIPNSRGCSLKGPSRRSISRSHRQQKADINEAQREEPADINTLESAESQQQCLQKAPEKAAARWTTFPAEAGWTSAVQLEVPPADSIRRSEKPRAKPGTVATVVGSKAIAKAHVEYSFNRQEPSNKNTPASLPEVEDAADPQSVESGAFVQRHRQVQSSEPHAAAVHSHAQQTPPPTRQGFNNEPGRRRSSVNGRQRKAEFPHPRGGSLDRWAWTLVALAALLLRALKEVLAICLWQALQGSLQLMNQLGSRCSVGLHLTAAGLFRRARLGRGRMVIATDALARLTQNSGDLIKHGAATASAAASRAAAEAVAARVAAVNAAATAGSTWNSLVSALWHAPTPATNASEPAGADSETTETLPESQRYVQLTPEEALATACSLWAALHNDAPSRRVGVLQFQDLLRRRLEARNGFLYLIPAEMWEERDGHQRLLTGTPEAAGVHWKEQRCEEPVECETIQVGIVARATRCVRSTIRSTFSACATLLSVLAQELHAACWLVVAEGYRFAKFLGKATTWQLVFLTSLARYIACEATNKAKAIVAWTSERSVFGCDPTSCRTHCSKEYNAKCSVEYDGQSDISRSTGSLEHPHWAFIDSCLPYCDPIPNSVQ
ncbi:uncharacterized protein LOC34620928 [Cyclospora cayetanensis]|uniref:Uncharacterized protein LOC34620928 n=1 Tax=Cyclospora cayetanensis TaxID=88456 RepID=A0A6P6RTR2_9EIME|nr:uncharacterized protein LOC34620928 [Cyclospora cayetanensis]